MPYLLRGVEDESGICLDFFTEALSRLDEDDTVLPIFIKAMADISAKLSTLNMNEDYKQYVHVSLETVTYLCGNIADHPGFIDVLKIPCFAQRSRQRRSFCLGTLAACH